MSVLIEIFRYLWPNWSEKASDRHAIFIATIVSVKKRENSLDWSMYCFSYLSSFPC